MRLGVLAAPARGFQRCLVPDSERGSQIVEFALIAPILLYLVLSIPVFALFARSWIVISGAARDGARAGAIHVQEGSDDQRLSLARQAAAQSVYLEHGAGGQFFAEERDVQVELSADYITVTVTYRQPTYLPLLGRLLNSAAPSRPDVVPLRATATFWKER